MSLHIRTYTFSSKKMPPVVGGLLVLGIGALLVAFGLTLLAGAVVLGTALGVGFLGYRAIRSRLDRALGRGETVRPAALDPSKEVFPALPSAALPPTSGDRANRPGPNPGA